ncbi:Rha family transcriptional regulator [Pseudovibrio sp. JE062]|uniref:Rha family transcriptional regulator n=1 Tax=Pseudovibrio sp. JE062 TaxID=439495 RepID=UPI0009FCD226
MESGLNLPRILDTGRNDEVTMTSKEIADLCGKRHDNVLVDIKKMLKDLNGGLLKFQETYIDQWNRAQPCYRLPRDFIMTLVSGYSVPLRHAIVTRLSEHKPITHSAAVPPYRLT